MARANGCGVELARSGFLQDFVGEIGEVGHFVAEDGGRPWSSPAAVQFAGFASVRGTSIHVKAVRGELRGDLVLLLVQRERRNTGGEIFYGEQGITGLDYRDANGVQIGIEEIGAVGSRVHPLRVQTGDVGTLGDVFGDHAEAGASLAGAVLHRRFTGKLMRELIHLGHSQGVLVRSGGQRGIPSQRRQADGGAIAVGSVKQGLVGGARLRRRSVQGGRDEQPEQHDGGDSDEAARSNGHEKLLLPLNTEAGEKVRENLVSVARER